jgi:two-component system, cell cycle response regulator DivK
MIPINQWKVLVIEDEHDSMELVQGVLSYHGIDSIGVSSAEEALEALKDIKPTLMIIDLQLPKLDGWGFLKQVRSNPALKGVACVAMTAYHSAELAEKAIIAGFDAYFSKPLDATSFVRELDGIING